MPERAIVPMLSMTSCRDMPTPLSATVTVRACASNRTWMLKSASLPPSSAGSVSASKRSLSQASEAFEISSRRKISLFEYREWTIRCSSCRASVWNLRVVFLVLSDTVMLRNR